MHTLYWVGLGGMLWLLISVWLGCKIGRIFWLCGQTETNVPAAVEECNVTRLKDLLPEKTEAEWTCGHVADAVCAECYRLLAYRAHELAMENMRLRDMIRDLQD